MDNGMNHIPRRSAPYRRDYPWNNANVFIICMALLWIVFLVVFVLNSYLLLQMTLGNGRIYKI